MTRLEQFGWRGNPDERGVGRVVSAHGDYYHVVCNETDGEILARKKKSVFKFRKLADRNVKPDTFNAEQLVPITGDFVRFRYNECGESLITDVLPRFSHFERKDPTARRQSQTLAVNFDVLFIMMSLNDNFSLPRLARYAALAEDVGEAKVMVLLTKADLVDECESFVAAARECVGDGIEVLPISNVTGFGLDAVRSRASAGVTIACIGSSGVGKSSLVNALAGEDWMAVGEIQEWSGKGRHTTTSRELVLLPSGALALDTPGIREIGMLGEVDEVHAKGYSTHRFRK